MDHWVKPKNGQDYEGEVVIHCNDHHFTGVACAFSAAGAFCVFGKTAHLRADNVQTNSVCCVPIGFRSRTDCDIEILVGSLCQ